MLIVPRREQLISGGLPTLRFMNFLEDLSRGANTTSENQDLRTQTQSSSVDLVAVISSLPIRSVSVDGDHTTIASELVLADDGATITLNDTPCDLEKVTVECMSGFANVFSNGKPLGDDGAVEISEGASYVFIYSIEADLWVVASSHDPILSERIKEIDSDLGRLSQGLSILKSSIGSNSDLDTVEKNTIVGSINEIHSELTNTSIVTASFDSQNMNINDVASLTTENVESLWSDNSNSTFTLNGPCEYIEFNVQVSQDTDSNTQRACPSIQLEESIDSGLNWIVLSEGLSGYIRGQASINKSSNTIVFRKWNPSQGSIYRINKFAGSTDTAIVTSRVGQFDAVATITR